MTTNSIMRSQELMSRGDTALLVIDVQEKLLPHIAGKDRLVWNIGRLLDAASLLGVHVLASEQYPQGLGATTADIRTRLGEVTEKTSFSCANCAGWMESLEQREIYKVLVSGIEAHVCVQQSALDFLAAGFRVYVAVDAVGSRHELDYHTALRRLEASGATLTTTESALFEWCETAATPEFKAVSNLVKQRPPGPAS